MAEKQIISRKTIQLLSPELKKAFAAKTDLDTIKAGIGEAIKGAKLEGNSIKLYKDAEMSTEAAFTLDLPAEMVLDQAKTKFEGSFTWSAETYPGSENPSLNGKPVLVLAVKGDGENPKYSFLDMTKLVDTYTAGAGDKSATVQISGYQISVKVNLSKEGDNQLTLKPDGLYVPKPEAVDVSGKADKVGDATDGHLAGLDGEGNLTDSGVAADQVLTTADISDFTAEEIQGLLTTD